MPAVQYGDVVDVKKRMRSIVKRLMHGENLIDVMTEGGMMTLVADIIVPGSFSVKP